MYPFSRLLVSAQKLFVTRKAHTKIRIVIFSLLTLSSVDAYSGGYWGKTGAIYPASDEDIAEALRYCRRGSPGFYIMLGFSYPPYNEWGISRQNIWCELVSSNPCGVGTVYNDAYGRCDTVSSPGTCLSGTVFDSTTGQCVAGSNKPLPAPKDEPTDQCVDNPILYGTGSKHQVEIDYRSEISDLAIQREYSSDKGNGAWQWRTVSSSINLYKSVDVATHSLPNPLYNSQGVAYIYLNRSGGVQLEFQHMGNGVWQSNTSSKTQLIERTNAVNSFEYVVSNANGDKEIYNDAGVLIETLFAQGKRQTYTYNTAVDALPDVDTLTITDIASGQSLQYSYDDANKIVQAIDAGGGVYQYAYTGNNLTQVVYPDNSSVQYHYENTTYPTALTGITDESGKRFTTWGYDQNGRANESKHGANDVGGASEQGNLTYTLNAEGDVILATHTNALGKVTRYNLSKQNGRNLVNHVDGETVGTCLASNSYYSYDNNGNRKTVTDKNGNVIETLRNGRGLIETERRGLQWSNGVNSTLVETAASQKIVTQWQAEAALPLSRTYYGWNGSAYEAYKREDTSYTTQNRIQTFTITDLTSFTQPYSTQGRTRVWQYSYNYYDAAQTQLQQQTVNGPRSDVNDTSIYAYDLQGNLSSVENALGHAVLFDNFNSRGLAGSITDANGNTTTMTYTPRGWLDILTQNGTAVSDYDYYPNGLLQKITLPDGSWLMYTYNDARHLTKVENNAGEAIHYVPNKLNGEWTQEVVEDASSNIVRQRQRVFDELGRLMTLQGQNGQLQQYRYDSNDNPITEQDALQQLTEYRYDAQNRISEVLDAEQTAKSDAAQRHAIAYRYDGHGNVKSVTDQRGNTTHYVYDGFGQLIQQTSPDTGMTVFNYDAAGNLITKTDARGVNVAHQYDALNRLLATLHIGNASEDINYQYDAVSNGNEGVGKLTGYSDVNGTASLMYGAWGLTQQQWCVASLHCYTTSYSHNAAGQLSGMQYPSGNAISYSYDTLGRLAGVVYTEPNTAAKTVISAISYYPFGGMKSISYGNGVVLNVTNDNDGRVQSVQAQGTGLLYSKTYGHAVTDNIVAISDVLVPANSRSYVYDKVSRLVQANKGETNPLVTQYSYDEVGNRTHLAKLDASGATVKDESLTYDSNSNRLLSLQDAVSNHQQTYTYDAVGNITAQTSTLGQNVQFVYNNGNRMTVSQVSNGDTNTYVVNALGQRIIKEPNGQLSGATYYHYGPQGELLAEHEHQGSELLVENIYINGMLVAQMDARKVDSDGDGWYDKKERQCNTNPQSASSVPVDTDADGMCNSIDPDDDNDLILDVTDVYPLVPIGLLVDTDGDGAPNDCDAACIALAMQADTDDDNDGWTDSDEAQCESNSLINTSVPIDSDGDGLCDARELAYCEDVFQGVVQSHGLYHPNWHYWGVQFKNNTSSIYNRYPHMGDTGNAVINGHHVYDFVNSCIDGGVAKSCVASGTPSPKLKNLPPHQSYNPATAIQVWAKVWIGFLKPGPSLTTYATDFNHVRVETDRMVTFLNNGSNSVRRIGWLQMDGVNSRFRFAPGDYYIDSITMGALGNNNHFEVYGTGVVRLFIRDTVNFHHVRINTATAPENFIIYGRGDVQYLAATFVNSYTYAHNWLELYGAGNTYNGGYAGTKVDILGGATLSQGGTKLSAAATNGLCQYRYDNDGDHWSNDEEVMCNTFPNDASSKPTDTDKDGQCNYLETDDDNDGIPDVADNCPLHSNVAQLDADIDGYGDQCDAQPNNPLAW